MTDYVEDWSIIPNMMADSDEEIEMEWNVKVEYVMSNWFRHRVFNEELELIIDYSKPMRLDKVLTVPIYFSCLEPLGIMNSHHNLKKYELYNEEEERNDFIVEKAKHGYDIIEKLLNRYDETDRSTVEKTTFITLERNRLPKAMEKGVRNKLKRSPLMKQDEMMSAAVKSAVKLVTDYNAGGNMWLFLDLCEQWGNKGDVFACIYAIVPDPDDKSHEQQVRVDEDEDIFTVKEDVYDPCGRYHLFIGYYGEKWKNLNLPESFYSIEAEETIRQWLYYKLWTTCNDEISAIVE